MEVFDAINKRRTIRRFLEKEIPFEALEKCVEAARLSPTAKNLQPLEFVVVHEKENRKKLLELVTFGGTVKEKGMKKGEEPKAFIIVLVNRKRAESYSGNDAGIAVQSIVLTAFEQGIGSCIMGAIDREKIRNLLEIPENFEIAIAIALGYPGEKSIIEESDEKTEYWIEGNTLHVPKRPLEKIMHKEKF